VAFDLLVVSIFSCPVFCPKLGLYLIPLQSPYLFFGVLKCMSANILGMPYILLVSQCKIVPYDQGTLHRDLIEAKAKS
jgi:hypothetical protein